MSFFSGAQGTSITGHIVTMTAYSGSQASNPGFSRLCENTTPSAFYGSTTSESGKDLGCLHGTRLGVQDHIFKWLANPESKVAMWMYGPAGIGKTAIGQTVAKLSAERGQLSSAFLFFRSDEGRNSAKHFVATLAFEMLQQMPHTHAAICTPIANNPLIFSLPLERQLRMIILPAISEPFPSSPNTTSDPMLFIIDGLDECIDIGAQKSIIRSFISLFAATPTPVRYKLLIVSRPESHIVSTFLADDITPHVEHLCLDEWESIADIEVFLRAELKEVKQTHPLKSYLDSQWPSEDSFQSLLYKSFESFAYATSAIRYISSHARHPDTSLNDLLNLNPDCAHEAHAELDSLYRHILESLDEKTRFTALNVLCLNLFRLSVHIETFSFILGKGIPVIELAMIKMTSVIRLEEGQVSYYHTSFGDFLLDKERSGTLYLYSPSVGTAVARALISSVLVDTETTQNLNYLESGGMLALFSSLGADMQIHILKAFLETQLPTASPVTLNPFFGKFVECIESGSHLESHSDELKLLYSQALEHLITWLRSQFDDDTYTSDIILDICFMSAFVPQSYLAHKPWDLVFDLVRRSKNPWRTICRLLPDNESWNICLSLLNLYLTMPQDTRFEDMGEHLFIAAKAPVPYTAYPLTTILINFLDSEPTNNEVCHTLEQIVSEAIFASSSQMATQNLISLYLSQDTCKSKQAPNAEYIALYTPLAKAMDMYIRRTHAKSDFPYISEDIRRLYCDATL